MAKLSRPENRFIEEFLEMTDGYVLDFSDRTMSEFFEDELGIDIYQEKYGFNGTSKAKHLRAFIEVEDGYKVAEALKKLWAQKLVDKPNYTPSEGVKDKYFSIVSQLESGHVPQSLDSLKKHTAIHSLDTVARDLDRAIVSVKSDPESAVTSACSTIESVCRSILIELNLPLPSKKDIKGLYNAVKGPLGLNPDKTTIDSHIADDVRKILGGLATTIEGIGALRTHAGDAHGREKGFSRIDPRIASLAVHSASSVALFLIETWNRKYPQKDLRVAV